MANKPAPNKTKRLVKNPETFRERALKATELSNQPKNRSKLNLAIRKTLRKVFGPLKRGVSKAFNKPPLKYLKKPLRILGLILVPKYLRSSWKELKQVSWPSIRESIRLTYAVLAFAIVFGLSIALVDYGLDKVFKQILLK